MFLSRSGIDLSKIALRQQQALDESVDRSLQRLQRQHSEEGSDETRTALIHGLRRADRHDEADAHELSPEVAKYQSAHRGATKAGREQLGRRFSSPRDLLGAHDHLHKKGFAHSEMIRLARRQLQRKLGRSPDPTGRKVIHDHEIAEHLTRHLDPNRTLDGHHLTQQILDLHRHRDGQGGGTISAGSDNAGHIYTAHAMNRRDNKPFDLRGSDWETRHSNDAPESDHSHSPSVEALKSSLSHHRAGTVRRHAIHVHQWGDDTMALHHLRVYPGVSGDHAKPTITHRS